MKVVNFLVLVLVLILAGQLHAQKLKATATAHSATLTWGASTVPTGAPALSGYNVYRGTAPGGEGATPIASPGNVLTFVDSTVTAGGNFCYQVTAVNAAGESPKSNEICVQIPNPVPPSTPTNLTVTVQ